MGKTDIFGNMIEQKLLSLHTAYLAKVISVSDDLTKAKIQPLGKTKAYGEDALSQSPLSDVPISRSARYKISEKSITYMTGTDTSVTKSDGYVSGVTVSDKKTSQNVADLEKIKAGDIVVCICCERNISDAKKGINSVPPKGHHSMSDSIIISIL